MRLLVCGDRHWTNKSLVASHIKELAPSVVIEGEAKGADSIARDAALALGITVERYPAQWAKYGRAAGPVRNQQMLDEGKPDAVLAFHNNIGESKGTRDMCKRAERKGLKVTIVKENEQ